MEINLKDLPEELIVEAVDACIEYTDYFNNNNHLKCHAKACWDAGDKLKQALKPKLTPVDMSVFIDSPIDCEFWTHKNTVLMIGQLARIKSTDNYFMAGMGDFRYCKPRLNYPYSKFLFEDEFEMIRFIHKLEDAGFVAQKHYAQLDEIVAFSIVDTHIGRCMPWECNND